MIFDDVFNARHSLIVGDAGSGKTTLALTLGALALHRGYRVGLITQQDLALPGAQIARTFGEIGPVDVVISDFPPPPIPEPIWQLLAHVPIAITVVGVSRRDQVLDLIPHGLQSVSTNIWQVRCTRIVVLKSDRYYPGDVFPIQMSPTGHYVGVGQFDGEAAS